MKTLYQSVAHEHAVYTVLHGGVEPTISDEVGIEFDIRVSWETWREETW
jgi:hypothetical protein